MNRLFNSLGITLERLIIRFTRKRPRRIDPCGVDDANCVATDACEIKTIGRLPLIGML